MSQPITQAQVKVVKVDELPAEVQAKMLPRRRIDPYDYGKPEI